MAFDSRNKRGSAIGINLASAVLPNPDGAIDQGDRIQVGRSYRGLSGVVPPIPPTPPRGGGCCPGGSGIESIEAMAGRFGLPLQPMMRDALAPASWPVEPGECVDPCLEPPATVGGLTVNVIKATSACGPCAPVPCGQPVLAVPQGSCGPVSPGMVCGNPSLPGVPYYQQSPICVENNRQTVIVEKLVGSFKNKYSFAVPACGSSVKVVFDKVGDVPIGAWLWAFGIGYFTIVSFNPCTGEIELRNDCPEDLCAGQVQASPGTPISACTVFVLQVPFCSQGGGGGGLLFPYLNSGFVAPINGACIDIAVTTTNGLFVNAVVSLSTGEYRISAILSSTLVTICNDGAGITPGTVVEYKDAAGNLIVPIVPIQSNPCLNTESLTGVPLACVAGTQVPLVGTLPNQVLAWTGSVAQFQSLGIPTLDCTSLTVGLTLDPLLPPGTDYPITVQDTSAFTIGQNVTLGLNPFQITNITSATNMRVLPLFPVVVVTNYLIGTTLCSLNCCADLDLRVTPLESRVLSNINADAGCTAPENKWLYSYVNSDPTLDSTLQSLAANGAFYDSVLKSLSITNESCDFDMGLLLTLNFEHQFNIEGGAAPAVEVVELLQQVNFAAGPTGLEPLAAILNRRETFLYTSFTAPVQAFNTNTLPNTLTAYIVIPAGQTWIIRSQMRLTRVQGNLTGVSNVGIFAQNQVFSAVGIAIR